MKIINSNHMKFILHKKHIPYLIITVFSLLFFFMGIANHYFFRTVTYDYGNYNFAFWDYSHFRISSIPTYPGNFLQDHFSFTLMYFTPVYWLINWLTGTYTLIIIQYSLITIAAWFTWKFIMLKTDNFWLGAGVLVYYFVLLGRFTSFSCDVNIAVISSCFVPVFLYSFEREKYLAAFAILILSLFSRENMPLWFISIFIVLIIRHHKDKRAVLLSVAGIAVSLIYFILLFKIFIPSVETDENQYTLFNYSALGADPGEAFMFMIKNPIETIKLFFVNHLDDPALDGVKAEFYIVYLVSGGIVLLLRPQYLIWFIPVVAHKVLNDHFVRWGISTYYSIEVVTLLPLAVFLTLSSLKSRILQNGLTLIIIIATISMTLYKLESKNVEIPWTMNPAKEKFYTKEFYQSPLKVRKTHKILNSIPQDAIVSASDHLLPHLAQRQFIYLFPDVKDAEYIVFSVFDNYFMYSHMKNEKQRNKYLSSPDWEIIAKEFPVFLLKKKKISMPNENKNVNTPAIRTDTIYCNYENVDSVNNLVYFNDSTPAVHAKKIVSDVTRSGSAGLLLDPQNPYGTTVKFEDAEQLEYIYATVWYRSTADHANIVVSCGPQFHYLNNIPENETSDGWKRLELGFWVPRHLDLNNLSLYLWNSGNEPVYFDDFQIVKRYKN